MKVVHSLKLDVKKTNVQKIIEANQSEGLDRKLVITLTSGNKTLHLDSDEQSASIIGTKPDGTHIVGETRIKDGKVIYYIKPSTVSAVGDVDCQVKVVSDGVTYSAKFTIQVAEPLYTDEDIESTDEFSELVRLTQKVEKQVTVFRDEGEPDTDPETYEDIKESDFYYDETNKKMYYATDVTTTISWERFGTKTELDLKADKATTFTKAEVQLLLNPKGTIWKGTSAPGTRILVGTTYTGIKEGEIYLYDYEGDGLNFIPCLVSIISGTQGWFIAEEASQIKLKTTNPPASTSENNYITVPDGTIWVNMNTNRAYLKTGITGEEPEGLYHWQDLTGNRVFFGTTNPDDGTALGKLTIGTSFVGISKGDIYVCEDNSAYPLTGFENAYYVKSVDSTTAYLKKFNKVYFMDEAPPEYGAEAVAAAVLDKNEIFEEGTVWVYEYLTHGSYIRQFYLLTHIQQTQNNLSQVTIKYTWKTLEYAEPEDISDLQEQINEKQDKLTAGTNITIDSNNVISATGGSGGSYTAGDGIDISNDEISVKLYDSQDNGLMFNSDGTLALFKSVLARDSSFRGYLADTSTQNPLQPKLTEGKNISIESDGKTISAVTPNFRLIKTITLTESNDSIVINEDEEGNAFECSEVLLSCSNILGGDNANLYISANDGVSNRGIVLPNPISSTMAKIITSKIISDTTMAQLLVNLYDSSGYYNNVPRINSYRLLGSLNHIQEVVISSNQPFTSGTFNLYGR